MNLAALAAANCWQEPEIASVKAVEAELRQWTEKKSRSGVERCLRERRDGEAVRQTEQQVEQAAADYQQQSVTTAFN